MKEYVKNMELREMKCIINSMSNLFMVIFQILKILNDESKRTVFSFLNYGGHY